MRLATALAGVLVLASAALPAQVAEQRLHVSCAGGNLGGTADATNDDWRVCLRC